jgi:hypothetical protein
VTAGVFSACLLGRVDGAMTGGVDPLTGDTSVTLPLDVGIFLGTDIGEPCPLCTLGECSAGVRAGQFCQVDGSDATFGDVSYDCMPNGFGTTTDHFLIQTSVTLTTGAVSLPFAVPCDPPFENQICACGICSGNLDVACNSDAECAAAGAGTCTADSGRGRVPNRCDDSICTQDPAGPPGEGKCLAGPTYSWCDGFVSSSGGGVIPCSDDLDCGTHADDCPGSNCGQCTLQQQAECFLDPIEAQGVPGKSLVGIGCLGRTIWHGFDQAVGIPGAYRVRTSMRSEVYCSNGVTPYVPPGGSNCSSLPGCLEAVVLCGPIEHHEFAGAMLWSVARDGTLTGSASVCQDFGCAGDVSGRIDAAGHVEATLTFEDGRQFAFGGTVGCNGLGSGTWKPGVGTWSIVPCG